MVFGTVTNWGYCALGPWATLEADEIVQSFNGGNMFHRARIRFHHRKWLVPACMALLAAAPGMAQELEAKESPNSQLDAHAFASRGGALFVMTASTDVARGNEVAMFQRAGNGDLSLVGFFPTGNLATEGPQFGAGPTPTSTFLGLPVPVTLDAHASADSLTLSQNRRCLFAVNAGSSSVSSFRVLPGSLELVSVVDSKGGGSAGFPVSVSESRGTLYVLNSGDSAGLAGFRVSHRCELLPDRAATRSLAGIADSVLQPRPVEVLTAPAHVLFAPDGRHLAVAIKGGDFPNVPGLLPSGRVVIYPVQPDGRLGAPTVTPFSSPEGRGGPFGIFFTASDTLVVTHSNSRTIGSYRLGRDDRLELLSGPFPTGALAPCWIDQRGRFLYVVSIGDVPATGAIPDADGVIDGFRVAPDGSMGELGLRIAYPAPPPGQSGNHGIDLRIVDRFLYFLEPRLGRVGRYTIGPDGSLEDSGRRPNRLRASIPASSSSCSVAFCSQRVTARPNAAREASRGSSGSEARDAYVRGELRTTPATNSPHELPEREAAPKARSRYLKGQARTLIE